MATLSSFFMPKSTRHDANLSTISLSRLYVTSYPWKDNAILPGNFFTEFSKDSGRQIGS